MKRKFAALIFFGFVALTVVWNGRRAIPVKAPLRLPASPDYARPTPAKAPATPAPAPVSASAIFPAPPPQAQSSGSQLNLRGFTERWQKLKACEDGSCAFPKSDPRSYEFALGLAKKSTLFEFADWVRAQHIEQPEIAALAREALSSDDGHVQEAGLDLMSTQPPSPENLDALLGDVLQGYDAQLIEQALLELERYPDRRDVARIDQALAQAMLNGAPFVAREVSAHISPFLNSGSVSFFKQLAASLPPQSVYRGNLENSLNQYLRDGQDS